MGSLPLTVLGAILGAIIAWLPGMFFWVRNRFTSTKAPSITFRVRPVHRPGPGAVFQCKILIDIKNELPGQSVRLAGAYFVFKKNSPLNPDPKWSREHKTGRFHLCFFSHATKMHDWRDVYLRSGETTNTWIGVDPKHSDYDIEQASGAGRIGRLYFQMTRWTESGNPKTRWVRVNI
jgi:hypothetical protein